MIAGTHVELLCVEPLEHQAEDRDRAQAQDVGDPHDVLAQSRRVCVTILLLPSGAARGALRFQQ